MYRAWAQASLLFSSLLILSACQTTAFKAFDGVQNGMNKASVLEIVGNPTKSQRVGTKDRWVWEFQDRTGASNWREVDFEHGRVIYAGTLSHPKISAVEQDKVNDSIASDEARQDDEERDRRDRAMGAFRPKKNPKDEKLDAADIKLRESLYGLPADPEIEKRKVAPVFVPVK